MDSLIHSGFDVTGFNQLPCNMVNNFTTSWERCNFIIRNECLEEEALDYVYFNYCMMGSEFKYISIMIIIFLLSLLFVTLSTIADEFLCPSLLTIANNLRMSENLAGITLLAFGNGSSDIFSSLAASSSGKAELIVSELLGAGIFCLSIVAGLIFIKQDFRLAYRPLLRDTIFYLFAVYFIWFICWNQQITLYYALAFILIYVIYLTVALAGQAIYLHLQQVRRKRLLELASNQEKTRPVVVRIDQFDGDTSGKRVDINNNAIDGLQDKRELSIVSQENDRSGDWSHSSDWFVQSHDSIRRRRRLSKGKLRLLSKEDKTLLGGKPLGETKYGSNQHVTHIRVDYITNSNQNNNNNQQQTNNKTNDVESNIENSNNTNVEVSSKEKSALGRKLSILADVNPTLECISKSECCKSGGEGIKIVKNTKSNHIRDKIDKFNSIHHVDDIQDSLSTKKLSLSSDGESNGNVGSVHRISISSNDWDNLFIHLNPLNLSDWAGANLVRRVIAIVRSPLVFIAICTIPVVDYDKKRNNWCRLLNIFHCISIPLVLLIKHHLNSSQEFKTQDITGLASFLQHYYPTCLLMAGSLLAVYMLRSTKSDHPPRYHVLFSYAGFLMSILWVYTLVTEILGLLKTIGIIFSMSDTTIGLAFLAWGNSLGDIVANLALAEAGYPRMAIGACIGAPLLNLLMGFGLSFAINLSPGETVAIEYSPTLTLLCLSLAIVILSLMLCTVVPPNHSKKPFGYVLISAYFIYFILAISLEFELIVFN